MMKHFLGIALLCTGTVASAGPDRDLGAIVRHDVTVQLVNPHADTDPDRDTGTSGRRAADALTRYQTGKLKPLIKTNGKTDVGGQGGANDTSTNTGPLVATGQANPN